MATEEGTSARPTLQGIIAPNRSDRVLTGPRGSPSASLAPPQLLVSCRLSQIKCETSMPGGGGGWGCWCSPPTSWLLGCQIWEGLRGARVGPPSPQFELPSHWADMTSFPQEASELGQGPSKLRCAEGGTPGRSPPAQVGGGPRPSRDLQGWETGQLGSPGPWHRWPSQKQAGPSTVRGWTLQAAVARPTLSEAGIRW